MPNSYQDEMNRARAFEERHSKVIRPIRRSGRGAFAELDGKTYWIQPDLPIWNWQDYPDGPIMSAAARKRLQTSN